ncbi:MAG: Bax inhibitor-1 family protein [Phycisphaerales bacterium]
MASFNEMQDATAGGVAYADVNTRATFIAKTYFHLIGAVIAFTVLEMIFFTSGVAQTMAQAMLSVNWLFVLGGFVVFGWIATHVAHRTTSLPVQYLALAGYVVGEAIIFIPLLWLAQTYVGENVIASAAVATLFGFSLLSLIVFFTRKDFSFLRGLLFWGMGIALVFIVCGAIFGFTLGPAFSVAMIALAGGAILYDTSNVLHHYPEDRYVAASLELFASVALLFWYVLQLFMSLSRE